MHPQKYDIIVVGAGVSGITAAARASELGSRVLLLEKMEKPLRKLRISGKGRGNISNAKPMDEFLAKIFPSNEFMRPVFTRFFSAQLVQLLNRMGLRTIEERGGRIFPASGRAWDVAEAMIGWAKKSGATLECNARVTDIRAEHAERETSFIVTYEQRGARRSAACRKLLLATGGASYPATGSTGDGYRFAQQLGHTLTPIRPSLVPIELAGFAQWRFADLTLRNVRLATLADGEQIDEEFGELMLTPFGVSGAIVLRQSRNIVDAFRAGKNVRLALDLKPALSETQLANRLERELQNSDLATLGALLRKLMPAPLVAFFAAQLERRTTAKITEADKQKIVATLKSCILRVSGHRPFTEAVVTAGGVSLHEVDAATLQSKRQRGLYLAGELLDLDADTGGYNLQIAFSTGWVAGEEMSS
jgi:predicted Rossmann fold flavoprotein